MKKRVLVLASFLCAILLVSMLSVVSALGLPNGIDQDLVSYWSFDTADGSDGSTAPDTVGSNNGNVVGAAPGVPGRLGIDEAYNFDGNDYINIGDKLDFPGNIPFSISVWVNLDSVPTGSPNNYHPIITKGEIDHNQPDAGYGLHFSSISNLRFRVCDRSQTACISRISTSSMNLGTWYHVVATYSGDSSSSAIRIYINGVRTDSLDDNRGGTFFSLENTGADFFIGRGEFSTRYSFFGGSLDEVGIWSRVLDETEIQELYDAYICEITNGGVEIKDLIDNDCDGLIDEADIDGDGEDDDYGLWIFGDPNGNTLYNNLLGYWDFNLPDSTDTIAADSSGNNNTGDVLGDTDHIIDLGILGDAYQFYSDDTISFSDITSMPGSYSWWQKGCDSDVWTFYTVVGDTVYVNGQVGSLPADVLGIAEGKLVLGDGFCGYIDQFAVWSRDLTSTEITFLFEYYFSSLGLTIPVIGDGIISATEECDDNNTECGDGCCNGVIEDGWRCATNVDGVSECCQDQCTTQDRTCIDTEIASIRGCVFADPPTCNQYDENWETTETCDLGAGEICQAGFCVLPGEQPIRFCSDYTDQEEAEELCEAAFEDDPDVCARSVNDYLIDKVSYMPNEMPSDFCDTDFPLNPSPVDVTPLGSCNYYAQNCSCEWDDGTGNESTGEPGCGHAYLQMVECNKGGLVTQYYGECVFDTTKVENDCAGTGFITYTRNATWVSKDGIGALPGTCDPYTKKYECVETAELPFFTLASFIISCMLIICIYAYFINKRK